MGYKKVKGGEFITGVEYENILDREKERNTILTNVSVINMDVERIHVIINNGDELPLDPGETLSFGDLTVNSLVVAEKNVTVRYVGVE